MLEPQNITHNWAFIYPLTNIFPFPPTPSYHHSICFFVWLFVVVVRFHIKVKSCNICPSPTISLSIMSSSAIHVVSKDRISFLDHLNFKEKPEIQSCIYILLFKILSVNFQLEFYHPLWPNHNPLQSFTILCGLNLTH